MRRALSILCVVCLPGVAVAQVGQMSGTAANSYSRPSIFVGPSYRGTGDNFYIGPRSANLYTPTSGSLTRNVVPSRSAAPMNTGTWHHAGYSRNPYYPSLSFTPPTDIRPQEYVIPPVTRTPLHDPYFDERVYETFDDAYEYWGW
jgi:hypothetical protein